jgi:hypothetical protein
MSLRENEKTQQVPLIAKAREGRLLNVSPARQGWVSIPMRIPRPGLPWERRRRGTMRALRS